MVAIDFEKAFDSVGRVALIRALKYYKCDPGPWIDWCGIGLICRGQNGDMVKWGICGRYRGN